MAKGFKDNKGKFHPIKNYKRKARYVKDEPFDVVLSELPTQKQLIQMQRQPSDHSRRYVGVGTSGMILRKSRITNTKKLGKNESKSIRRKKTW